MALKPQNEDAFFREVDEELRREQIGSFWRRYGVAMAVALVLVLAALGGWLYWQHRQTLQAGATGEQMDQALRDLGEPGKGDAARAALAKLAKDPIKGFADDARLTLAAAAIERGDMKGAASQYGAVAADKDAAQPFRDLALIRQTAVEFDTLPPDQVIARLKPLAVAGNPWFGSAGEMTAVAYLKMNKPDLAGSLFAALARDEGVPESVRSRAQRIAGALGQDITAQRASPAPGPAKE